MGAALAPSLGLMLIARFVWGLGAAGPRVAAVAMVRDAYEGERMARQMSNMMAVFLVVPTLAPSLGAGLVVIGPWQLVFWVCLAASVAVFGLSIRLPATLPATERRSLSAGEVWRSIRVVFSTPGTTAYLVAMTALFASFISYLASSEIIVDEVFGLASWFPLIFGGLAVAMGLTMIANGRVVERVGLEHMLKRLVALQIVASLVLLVVAMVTGGTPPFALFITVFVVVLGSNTALTPNLNSAAMRPLGHVAGTAAALLGMVPMVVGSLLGSLIDRTFDGTITPIALAFTVGAIVALVATRSAMATADRAEARSTAAIAVS
jgi:DHA1 family bicyclomycin/chloramphenicol resistance-like MFS transporter